MSRIDSGNDAAALRAAASVGDLAACQHYLRSCRSVRFSRDNEGRSALHLAAIGGHKDVIRLFLSVAAPKEIDSADASGYTALQIAASQGHEEVIKLLLAQGADVNANDSLHGNSALHEAAWKGYSRSIRLLITGGANLNKFNFGGFTALHLSCQNGHNQSCRELLLAGSSPDIQNNYGDTSLHTAARYGHAGVTRILISAQCRVSAQNKNGDTALHIAAAMGRRKLTRILLEAGCEKGARNKQGETAKDIAVRKNLSEVLYIIHNFSEKQDDRGKFKKKYKNKHGSEGKSNKDNTGAVEKKHWSPYGCHYYPDLEVFPCPRLDSLPKEPLKHGEQYYLDLAGNICKGPVGVGYTCYCAPFFKHLKIRMERDKREFQRAQVKLDQRVANLEHLLQRKHHTRASERVPGTKSKKRKCSFSRSRSLEMLDTIDKPLMHTARSMDDVDNDIETKIPQHVVYDNNDNNSESSEEGWMEKGGPTMEDEAAAFPSVSTFNIFPTNPSPRFRGGVYSPTINESDRNPKGTENMSSKIEDPSMLYEYANNPTTSRDGSRFKPEMKYVEFAYLRNYETDISNSSKYYEQTLNSKLAKLRVLDNSHMDDMKVNDKAGLNSNYVTSHMQDVVDRDTNNDSGYSTKVYGSSKGNSPNLSGQIDNDCLGASSLV